MYSSVRSHATIIAFVVFGNFDLMFNRNMTLLYLATIMIWGTTWLPIKLSLGTVAPEVSVIYRLLIASAILFAWCAYSKSNLKFDLKTHLLIGLFGLCLYAIDLTLLYMGSAYLTSGLVAIIFSTIVFFNIVNKRVFFNEPIELSAVIGALVGVAGLCIAFWSELGQFALSASLAEPLVGLALVLGAAYAGSIGNITSSAIQRRGVTVTESNALGMMYGAVALLIYVLLKGHPFAFDTSAVYIGSLLYLSIFGSVIAFGCYLTLIGKIGSDKAAYANLLFPVVAVLISAYAESFTLSGRLLLALAVILFGNYLMYFKPNWLQRGIFLKH